MPNQTASPPLSFWVSSTGALVWNLLGVVSFLANVTMSPERLTQLSEAERSLVTDIPVWVTVSYAIAVLAGTLACVALLLRRSWAPHAFMVSLLTIVASSAHWLLMTPMLDVQGGGAAVLPVAVIVVALVLLWYSTRATRKGWLR